MSSSYSSENLWMFPSGLTINVGSVYSGTIEDLHIADGNYLILNEVPSASPAFDYDLSFEDVPDFNNYKLKIIGYYKGNVNHVVKLLVYNFTTTSWEYFIDTPTTDFPKRTSNDTYIFNVPQPFSKYTHYGLFNIKLYHVNNGSALNYMYLDEVILEDTESSSSSSSSSHSSSESSLIN